MLLERRFRFRFNNIASHAEDWLSALLLGILLLLSDFWALPLIVGLILITNTTSPNPPHLIENGELRIEN